LRLDKSGENLQKEANVVRGEVLEEQQGHGVWNAAHFGGHLLWHYKICLFTVYDHFAEELID